MIVPRTEEKLPTSLGLFRGVGNSQRPLIRHGDWVETEPVDARAIRPGDLAVFCAKQNLVCHRVLWRRRDAEGTWFFFKGDAEVFSDGWIPEYRLVGRVKAVAGIPLNSLGFRARSRALLAYSLLRTFAFRFAFLRPWGPWLGRARRAITKSV